MARPDKGVAALAQGSPRPSLRFGRATRPDGPLYCGYFFDTETALYQVRNRYYDSGVSAFISRDPIGYGGGINLYAYVEDNPASSYDPQGLRVIDDGGIETRADTIDLLTIFTQKIEAGGTQQAYGWRDTYVGCSVLRVADDPTCPCPGKRYWVACSITREAVISVSIWVRPIVLGKLFEPHADIMGPFVNEYNQLVRNEENEHKANLLATITDFSTAASANACSAKGAEGAALLYARGRANAIEIGMRRRLDNMDNATDIKYRNQAADLRNRAKKALASQ